MKIMKNTNLKFVLLFDIQIINCPNQGLAKAEPSVFKISKI